MKQWQHDEGIRLIARTMIWRRLKLSQPTGRFYVKWTKNKCISAAEPWKADWGESAWPWNHPRLCTWTVPGLIRQPELPKLWHCSVWACFKTSGSPSLTVFLFSTTRTRCQEPARAPSWRTWIQTRSTPSLWFLFTTRWRESPSLKTGRQVSGINLQPTLKL